MVNRSPAWWIGSLALMSSACADILDLYDAQLDPALSSGGGGSTEVGGGDPPEGGSTATHAHGGSDGSVGGAGGEGPTAPVCETYCATVLDSCTGPHAVYTTPESCAAVCALLPEGQEGDETGNTAHCRLRNAEIAATEPSFYCPIAGPGGNGVCGGNCDGLCTIAKGACIEDNAQWPSDTSCQTECGDLPDLETYSVDPDIAMFAGGHVQCRLFHASASAVEDADVHCLHVGGDMPCQAPSE
jgi:hypothetical protein